MTREEAVRELVALAHDPNRERLEEKFKRCPESRRVSELWARRCWAERVTHGTIDPTTRCPCRQAWYTRADRSGAGAMCPQA